MAAALYGVFFNGTGNIKGLGIEKIGIHQAGIQHAGEAGIGKPFVMSVGLQRRCRQLFRQGDFLLPNGIKIGNVCAERQGKALRQGAAVIALAVPICQTSMVSSNTKCHQLTCCAPAFYCNFRTRGGMVNRFSAAQACSKFRRVFTQVV